MEPPESVQIYVASNFTIQPVRKVISYWMGKQKIVFNNIFSESYQFIGQLYDTSSNFYKELNSFSVIFFRFENCFASNSYAGLDLNLCVQFVKDFQKALNFAANNFASPIIVIECPLSKELTDKGMGDEVARLRGGVAQVIAELQGVYFESQSYLFDLYPMESYDDTAAYVSTLMPYSKECYTALGTLAARKVSALLRKPKKVVVLDCDNTLWKGVAAEDGPSGVSIDASYMWLQNFMVGLYKRGMLLCLCSKNIEQDVWDTFNDQNFRMPLKKEHLIAWRINWDSKSNNIASLAEELNLSLDSFIFLDDNPIEINDVKDMHPNVECIQVPHDSQKIPTFLKHQWVFDILHTHDSDRNRTTYYRRESERKSVESNFSDYKQFLDYLNVELEFERLTENLIGRASQLTLRTNQFNFSGLKLSNLEFAQRINNSSSRCTIITAKDRFGDYGEIGCLLYRITEHHIHLENFLISCRALGKKIEHRIWNWLSDLAYRKGVGVIEIAFIETQRNQPAYSFLASLGIIDNSFDGEIIHYKMPNRHPIDY